MLATLRNAWRVKEIRVKLLFTLGIILVFRFGSVLPIPFVDASAISGALSYKNIVKLAAQVKKANVIIDGTAAYVVSPEMEAELKSTPKDAGSGLMVLENGIMNGISGTKLFDPDAQVNRAMFLAYIVMVPNATFMVSFLIPVKAKWLGIIYGILMGYEVIQYIRMGIAYGGSLGFLYYGRAVAIVISALNFLIFFMMTRNYRRISPSEMKRRAQFRKKMNDAKWESGNVVEFRGRNVITRHRCAVCGKTELDDDTLEFRFCSKCDGNYEYCSEHLYTHTHVKRVTGNTEE